MQTQETKNVDFAIWIAIEFYIDKNQNFIPVGILSKKGASKAPNWKIKTKSMQLHSVFQINLTH